MTRTRVEEALKKCDTPGCSLQNFVRVWTPTNLKAMSRSWQRAQNQSHPRIHSVYYCTSKVNSEVLTAPITNNKLKASDTSRASIKTVTKRACVFTDGIASVEEFPVDQKVCDLYTKDNLVWLFISKTTYRYGFGTLFRQHPTSLVRGGAFYFRIKIKSSRCFLYTFLSV